MCHMWPVPCREQLQKELVHLKEGVSALFNAMHKPIMDVQFLQSEHQHTRELVENVGKFKDEVTKSLSQLTMKCNTLDQHVPELREKLEQAITTINVRLPNALRLAHSHTVHVQLRWSQPARLADVYQLSHQPANACIVRVHPSKPINQVYDWTRP
jgi:predicted nuclease with TOPRIM domain